MAFESLTEKLQNVFKKLRSKGRLTEEDVKIALKEVKMALLEADVNFKVVKQFTKSVQERAVGQDVMNGLNPGQMVIKIVNDELVSLMGSETTELPLKQGNEITVLKTCHHQYGDLISLFQGKLCCLASHQAYKFVINDLLITICPGFSPFITSCPTLHAPVQIS